MSDELKPCPFCQGRAQDCGERGVKCMRCRAWGPDPIRPHMWNHRPEADTLRARVAELEAERDEMRLLLKSAEAAIDAALTHLRASRFHNAEHCRATEILAAALKE